MRDKRGLRPQPGSFFMNQQRKIRVGRSLLFVFRVARLARQLISQRAVDYLFSEENEAAPCGFPLDQAGTS